MFKDTWAYNHWDWSKTNPVLHFSFDRMAYQALGLDGAILQELNLKAKEHGIELVNDDIKSAFNELLEKVSQKHGKVALLIDEYDKPIIDYLEFPPYEQAKKNQAIMRQFYGVLKSAEPCLAFFFVTGVSKFSYPSEHSELNNVNDITLHPDYATITGYTQEELEFHFDEHLQSAEEHLKISRETLVKQMSDWYNGFSWDGEQQVYYPFSTLKFLEEKNFSNYWLPSADKPILLMRQMQKYANIEIENTRANSYTLNKFSLDNLDLVPLCFQTGYLTIKTLDRLEDEMLLDYPNKEVRESMSQFLIGVNFNESKKQIEGWVETN